MNHPKLMIIVLAAAAAACAAIAITACGAAGTHSTLPDMSASENTAPAASGAETMASDLMAAGTAAAEEKTAVKVTPDEAKTLIADGAVLVDVRREDEYAAGHIPGAILVPNESIGDTAPDALPDKSAKIIVYCRSGHRSALAAAKLIALGYENVYDLGGIINWPYETTVD